MKIKIKEKGGKFQIVEQTNRGHDFSLGNYDFYSGSYVFWASNGFSLASHHSPEVRCRQGSSGPRLYVRGDDESKDLIWLTSPSSLWMRLCCEAISEYNEIYKDQNRR